MGSSSNSLVTHEHHLPRVNLCYWLLLSTLLDVCVCVCHPCSGAMLIFSVCFQFQRMIPEGNSFFDWLLFVGASKAQPFNICIVFSDGTLNVLFKLQCCASPSDALASDPPWNRWASKGFTRRLVQGNPFVTIEREPLEVHEECPLMSNSNQTIDYSCIITRHQGDINKPLCFAESEGGMTWFARLGVTQLSIISLSLSLSLSLSFSLSLSLYIYIYICVERTPHV